MDRILTGGLGAVNFPSGVDGTSEDTKSSTEYVPEPFRLPGAQEKWPLLESKVGQAF